MKDLNEYIKESLLDDEEEIINKYHLIPLMKLVDTRNRNDYNDMFRKLWDQFKIFKENKIYMRGRYYDFSELNDDDLLICFEQGNSVKIGYKDFSKMSIVIFYSDFEDEVTVSAGAPFIRLHISNFNYGVYKLPDAFKDDFVKIVKKHQSDRKGRILL
jgi:hypothetical protein